MCIYQDDKAKNNIVFSSKTLSDPSTFFFTKYIQYILTMYIINREYFFLVSMPNLIITAIMCFKQNAQAAVYNPQYPIYIEG
jgi:hypothetical protein